MKDELRQSGHGPIPAPPTGCQVCAILAEVCEQKYLELNELLVQVNGQREGRPAELIAARRLAITRLYGAGWLKVCDKHGLKFGHPRKGSLRILDGAVEIYPSMVKIAVIMGYGSDHTTVWHHLNHQEYASRDRQS